MKKALLIVSACSILGSTHVGVGADAKGSKDASNKDVSVYQVPWRCPADCQIGCGSRAKPVLLKLEQGPAVAEAWLNREGTAVALVWKADVKHKARSEAEKELKEQEATRLTGKERAKVLAGFESGKGWYRGAEVDRLSAEEAAVIAARWVRRLRAKTTLTDEKAQGLQNALTDAVTKRLTGKMEMPQSQGDRAVVLRRVAGPFLDEKQMELLGEAAGAGMRAMSNEE